MQSHEYDVIRVISLMCFHSEPLRLVMSRHQLPVLTYQREKDDFRVVAVSLFCCGVVISHTCNRTVNVTRESS